MGKAGVYIQVPFCQTKCTYCNFHTNIVSVGRFAPYAEAVCREICEHAALLRGGRVGVERSTRTSASEIVVVDTVYIGGGTPSLLEPALLADMLRALRETFASPGKRVTLEADPETIEAEKAVQWAAAGIQRISLGTQSFVDEELKAADGLHRREDITGRCPSCAMRDMHISFDLIAGLPKQTRESSGHVAR